MLQPGEEMEIELFANSDAKGMLDFICDCMIGRKRMVITYARALQERAGQWLGQINAIISEKINTCTQGQTFNNLPNFPCRQAAFYETRNYK